MGSIIDVSNLSFDYNETTVLDDVSFQCFQGEKIALVGKNGSGKSTIVKLLDGLLEPKAGKIKIDSQVVNEDNIDNIRDAISMVFQDPDDQFVGATVADDIAFGMENRDVKRSEMVKRVDDGLQRFGITQLKNRSPESLSGGQKQRVALAEAIVTNPKILILDEATSMLDPKATQMVLSMVDRLNQEDGLTMLTVTHDVNVAAQADRVLALNDHKIVFDGEPADFFQQHDLITKMDLTLPFSESLKDEFKSAGYSVPSEFMDDQEIAKWILKLV